MYFPTIIYSKGEIYMKIAIIGATGKAGTELFKEATGRDHEVTAVVRNAEKAADLLGSDANTIVKDAFDLTRDDLQGFDVIVNAFATAPQTAYLHVDLAAKLVHLFRETTTTRLFFILGAGSLLDENDELFVETIRQDPNSSAFINVPEAQLQELNFLRDVNDVKWVGVSPGAQLIEGEQTNYTSGIDHILQNDNGESLTTYSTLAKAIIDEVEAPKYHKQRFTVINK